MQMQITWLLKQDSNYHRGRLLKANNWRFLRQQFPAGWWSCVTSVSLTYDYDPSPPAPERNGSYDTRFLEALLDAGRCRMDDS